MATPRRNNNKPLSPGDVFSPGSKRAAIDYDYLTEMRKVPKVVEQDMKEIGIKDLKVGKDVVNSTLVGKCLGVLHGNGVVKLYIHDKDDVVVVSGFAQQIQKMQDFEKGDIVILEDFLVVVMQDSFKNGNANGVNIRLGSYSTIKKGDPSIQFPLAYNFIGIDEIKSNESRFIPGSIVDIQGIVVKDRGVASFDNGPFQTLNLFDFSARSIYLSIPLKNIDTGMALKVDDGIRLKSVMIAHDGVGAYLQAKWFTSAEISPQDITETIIKFRDQKLAEQREQEEMELQQEEDKNGLEEEGN